jgi:hypothetical protein
MLSNNVVSKKLFLFFILFAIGVSLIVQADTPASGTTSSWRYYPDDPLWLDNDMRDNPSVAEFDLSKSYEFIHKTFAANITEGPALNVNTLGEVPNSSWFTNRIGVRDMTIEEILKGPYSNDGPAAGEWLVVGKSYGGVTPKFKIQDSRGDFYMIKLDPVCCPELPSSVESISTLIFHAIGYHVPEDFVVYFKEQDLKVDETATVRDDNGDKRQMDNEDIHHLLRHQALDESGRVRAIASRWVPGRVVGQFQYTETRPDDSNDIYPHERRRELRGLRVFAAWLNHDDCRSINSIDSYVEDNGKHYIRHYLQDFGSNLGSATTSRQQPRAGYEYQFEGDKIFKGLGSFGLWQRDWMHAKYSKIPSVGNVEAEIFDPPKWKTEYPNPAFLRMDKADAFWAAKIVAKFDDQVIQEIVKKAQLTDPAATEYLNDVIIKRRNKVVAYWITLANPVDEFKVKQNGDTIQLTFDNAAIRLGVAQPGASYISEIYSFNNATGEEKSVQQETEQPSTKLEIPQNAWGPADKWGFRYALVKIKTNHPQFTNWSEPVSVTLRSRDSNVDIVGIQRPY